MTCGVCNPAAFHPAKGKRVWGYAATTKPGLLARQVAQLYYMGCETVFTDAALGRVLSRPGYQALRSPILARKGDRVVFADPKALGSCRPAQDRRTAELQARGVEVMFLTDPPA